MAKCPFCEYTGASSSVEAHISGKSDETHKGKVGSNYRGLIDATVGEGTDAPAIEVARSSEIDSDPPGGESGSPGWSLVMMTVLFVAVLLVVGTVEPTQRREERR